MQRLLYYSSIPVTLLTILGVVGACAPTKGTAPMESIKTSGGLVQALDDCRAQMRGKSAAIGNRWVQACEIPQEESIGFSVSEAAGSGLETEVPDGVSSQASDYRLVNKPVGYVLEENDGQLGVVVRGRLQFPKEMSDEARKRVLSALDRTCVPKIQKIWKRSRLDLKVSLAAVGDDDGASQDVATHSLKLEAVQSGQGALGWSVIMSAWPDRGSVRTTLTSEEEKRCAQHATQSQRAGCGLAALEAANDRFCVNLALAIGQWVGLESVEVQAKTCGQNHRDKVYQSVRGSYMKAGADRNSKGEKFWTTAKLSPTDLRTVLSRQCRSFQAESDKDDRLARSK